MSRLERLIDEYDEKFSRGELEKKIEDNLTPAEYRRFTRMLEDGSIWEDTWGQEHGKDLALKWADEHDHLPDEELVLGCISYILRTYMEVLEGRK